MADGDIGIAHHTSIARGTYRDDHGTPTWLLEEVRAAFGGAIELDLASSDEANKLVQAKRYYTEENPCPAVVLEPNSVWCNPPGPGKSVQKFWGTWINAMLRARSGAFLIFNMDHWRQLPDPLIGVDVVVLRKRLRFEGQASSASFPSALVVSGMTTGRLFTLGHTITWKPRDR